MLWALQDHSEVDLRRGRNSVNFYGGSSSQVVRIAIRSGRPAKVVQNMCVFLSEVDFPMLSPARERRAISADRLASRRCFLVFVSPLVRDAMSHWGSVSSLDDCRQGECGGRESRERPSRAGDEARSAATRFEACGLWCRVLRRRTDFRTKVE